MMMQTYNTRHVNGSLEKPIYDNTGMYYLTGPIPSLVSLQADQLL